jgi:hypothetical protein
MMSKPVVTIDESTPDRPRLVVEMPADQREAIQRALEALTEAGDGAKVQRIVSEALLTAVEQRYFWTPEWQAKEQEADEAVAEGRVRTFDSVDEMIDFLDAQ